MLSILTHSINTNTLISSYQRHRTGLWSHNRTRYAQTVTFLTLSINTNTLISSYQHITSSTHFLFAFLFSCFFICTPSTSPLHTYWYTLTVPPLPLYYPTPTPTPTPLSQGSPERGPLTVIYSIDWSTVTPDIFQRLLLAGNTHTHTHTHMHTNIYAYLHAQTHTHTHTYHTHTTHIHILTPHHLPITYHLSLIRCSISCLFTYHCPPSITI